MTNNTSPIQSIEEILINFVGQINNRVNLDYLYGSGENEYEDDHALVATAKQALLEYFESLIPEKKRDEEYYKENADFVEIAYRRGYNQAIEDNRERIRSQL